MWFDDRWEIDHNTTLTLAIQRIFSLHFGIEQKVPLWRNSPNWDQDVFQGRDGDPTAILNCQVHLVSISSKDFIFSTAAGRWWEIILQCTSFHHSTLPCRTLQKASSIAQAAIASGPLGNRPSLSCWHGSTKGSCAMCAIATGSASATPARKSTTRHSALRRSTSPSRPSSDQRDQRMHTV